MSLKRTNRGVKFFFKRAELAQLIIECWDLMTRDFGGEFFWVGYFFGLVTRGSGWSGSRVVAIGRRVKSENNGLGSPIQLGQGVERILSFFAPEPPS